LFKRYFNEKYYLSCFLLFFTSTLGVGLFIQLIALPFIFPSLHAGDGLLIGGDWLLFNETAMKKAVEIQIEGWQVWELRPQNWFASGVASALYVLIYPKPWVLMPLNAMIHALSALILIKIVLLFYNNRVSAFLSVIPFTYFPSATLWYAQIHRDGYYILGMFLFLYGLLLFCKINNRSIDTIWFLLAAIMGIFIIWLARPYAVVIYYYVGFFIILAIVCFYLIQLIRDKYIWRQFLFRIIMVLTVLIVTYAFSTTMGSTKYQRELPDVNTAESELLLNSSNKFIQHTWIESGYLPGVVEKQLYSMSLLRQDYINAYGEKGSCIDTDLYLQGAHDYIMYLPRALQIALFAPFPAEWVDLKAVDASRYFKLFAAIEMASIYLIFVPLLIGIYIWRKRFEIYIAVSFCLLMMLPIVYSVPNIGTIYRYRYGFIMILVALGISALCNIANEKFCRIRAGYGE